jgi:uncharacterized protein YgbK (DUF1537 family)
LDNLRIIAVRLLDQVDRLSVNGGEVGDAVMGLDVTSFVLRTRVVFIGGD